MSIDLDIMRQQGHFHLHCQLQTSQRVVGLFGPSGAGKSSLLRMMAGLSQPDSGHIDVAGRRLFDAGRGVNVAPHRRRIGFVFQDALLFPHFNVEHNLCFGSWFQKRRLGRQQFDQVVAMLDIGHLLKRRVRQLSGGERRRVAIGRALLADPALLLLDEPLAGLDVQRRQEVLPYIERISRESELPIIFVSHQLDDLLSLANRHIAAMHDGRIVFSGATADFMTRADLMGEGAAGSLLQTRPVGHDVHYGLSILTTGSQRLYVPRLSEHGSVDATVVHVRARDVMLSLQRPASMSALNCLQATVQDLFWSEDQQSVRVQLSIDDQRLDASITALSADTLALHRGMKVYAVIKSLALAEQAWQRLSGL